MSDEVREELTSYLDGELDPVGSRRVEERLKHDPAYRDELQRLEQAWHMLDQLDRAVVGDGFTRTTMEMVAVAAAEDARHSGNSFPGIPRIGSLAAIVALAAALLVATFLGFACGKWIWPDPNAQLLHEMPILENIDLYDQGDSIDFLRKLERLGAFDQDPAQAAAAPPSTASPEEELDERRAEIERMTPLERQHLRRQQDHFARYSLDDQRRMVRLYDELDRDPHEDELRRVLARYHEWLDTLALSARAELTDLPLDQRIAKIKELKQQQTVQRAQELQEGPTEQDLQAIVRWVEEYGWQHREALFGTLSPARQQYLEQLDESKQRRAMLWLVVHHSHQGNKAKLPRWDDKRIDKLTGQISAGAAHRLAALDTPEEKQKMIAAWVQTAIRNRVEAGGIRQLMPPIDGQELQRFLRDELSAEQREALLPLSREQRHRLLLRMYFVAPQRLAQLRPGQMPGWPQVGPRNSKPGGRPKAGKPAKTQA